MNKISFIFLSLYLFVGLVPYLGVSDKVVSQNLYLNLLNLSGIIYLIYTKKNILECFKTSISNWPYIFYFLFFIWSCITLVNSINISESLSIVGDLFTLLVAFTLILFFLNRIKDFKQYFFYIIISLSFVEVITVLIPYLIEIYYTGSPIQRGQTYRGYTGNINILAYLLLMKLPFIVYFQIIKKGNFKFNFLLIVSKVFIITAILATRSAMLSLIATTLIIIILFFVIDTSFKKNYLKILKQLTASLLLPILIAFVLNNLSSLAFNTVNAQDRIATLNNINNDNSLKERLTYYEDAFLSFLEKPIMGKGIGTWEIESINYVNEEMEDYVVPYHAHNDFLETLAETGIIGFFLYFGTIFYVMFFLLKKILDINSKYDDRLFAVLLFSSILIYLFDSMFNFPFARVIQQIFLLFILSISIIFLKIDNKNFKLNRLMTLLLITLMPFSIYSSSRLFNSSKHQAIFLRQFNNNNYSSPPLEVIENFETKYKSLSATSMPMSTIKGLYYMRNDRFRDAIPHFKDGIRANPYLFISESFLGYSYLQLNMLDSALYYSKIAYDNMPKNSVHFANYLFSLGKLKDSVTIKNTFNSLDIPKNERDQIFDEIYLTTMSALSEGKDVEYALQDIDINIESGNDRLKKGYYTVKVGVDRMYNADRYYQTALYFFEEENYTAAADFFMKADELNPYELAYKENAANSYMKLGQDEKALEILNDLIDNFNAKSQKAHYLRGLLNYSLGNIEIGCKDLKYAYEGGFIADINLYQLACLNSN